MHHPEIPDDVRGTYAGLSHPAMIDHLRHLGVTSVELLPVHQFVHDSTLADRGLSNYWGYNTIGFFAPHNGYACFGTRGEQVQEFRTMVRALHREGIEVILDVVYNHTAEGNHLGPTLSFRGIDNSAYYRLVEGDPQFYFDTTGTGNSLNVRNHETLRLIMDSLRYWITEMHVDGFRFDLASSLAREFHSVDRLAAFFDLVNQDPVVSQVKLIAEPWDLGEGGYQVGGFPPLWTEWNGRYRDTVRDFWRGGPPASAVRRPVHRIVGPVRGGQPPPIASIASSPHTTASLSTTSCPTTRSTTGQPEATATARTTTVRGTWRRTDRRQRRHRPARRQKRNILTTRCCPQGVPMIPTATSSAAPQKATTTPTARTTSSRGSTGTGPATTRSSPSTSRSSPRSAPGTRSSGASGSSRAARSWAPTSTTSPGCAPTDNT
jgi:glycogen operon protein